MDIKDIYKNIDMKEFVKKMNVQIQQDKENKELFWNSSMCKNMIADMIKAKEGFNADEFSYFPEKIKLKYNWTEIANEDIKTFIAVMSDNSIGLQDGQQPEVDESCSFNNFSFVKRGIKVFVMIGQGSFINLSPA